MSLSSDIWKIMKEKTMKVDYGQSFVFNLTLKVKLTRKLEKNLIK